MAEAPKTKIDLLKALREARLPFSYKTMLKYEADGIIPRMGKPGEIRYFTDKEIKSIVNKVKNYKHR